MSAKPKASYIAFDGTQRIAMGSLAYVALKVKVATDEGVAGPIFVFNAATSEPVQIDLRGTPADVLARHSPAKETAQPSKTAPRGRGRPKLGVVPREITLLPQDWDWLNEQPGGASLALRKLVDRARSDSTPPDIARRAQDAATRFLAAMAIGLPGLEHAKRALLSGDAEQFSALVAAWPVDVRDHAKTLAAAVFNSPVPATAP